jgi:hypothetical protein
MEKWQLGLYESPAFIVNFLHISHGVYLHTRMCTCNMCTCIYCVLYCLYCVFVLFCLCIFILICFVCISVRTTAIECKLNCSSSRDDDDDDDKNNNSYGFHNQM